MNARQLRVIQNVCYLTALINLIMCVFFTHSNIEMVCIVVLFAPVFCKWWCVFQIIFASMARSEIDFT